jgi:hypothetical protein
MSSANFRKSRDHRSSHHQLATAPLLQFPADTLPSLHPGEGLKARGLVGFVATAMIELNGKIGVSFGTRE